MGLFRNKRVFGGFARSRCWQLLSCGKAWNTRDRLANHKIRAMIESMLNSALEIAGAENRSRQETNTSPDRSHISTSRRSCRLATALWRAQRSGFSVAALWVPEPANPPALAHRSGIAQPGPSWPLEPRWRPATPSHPSTNPANLRAPDQPDQPTDRRESNLCNIVSRVPSAVSPCSPTCPDSKPSSTSTPTTREPRPAAGSRSISRPSLRIIIPTHSIKRRLKIPRTGSWPGWASKIHGTDE